MIPRCTHPQVEFMVIGQTVFVKCAVCAVRGRLFMTGAGNNQFTSITVQIALEGFGCAPWVALKCATDGCDKLALRGATHCAEHNRQGETA